jgi:hypothetical protein
MKKNIIHKKGRNPKLFETLQFEEFLTINVHTNVETIEAKTFSWVDGCRDEWK